MFSFFRPSPEIEAPKSDAELLRSPCRRQSYIRRLGMQQTLPSADAQVADTAELPKNMSMASIETESTASGESWSTSSTDSEILSPMEDHNEIRQKYLRKLAYNKVWVPQVHRSPKHQTVMIFDWDDTLLPTVWLRKNDFQSGDDDKDEESLRGIVQHSKKILEIAIKAGSTYIITNAQSGWVEYSAARWAPELLPVLRKVKVISARDRFEPHFPHDIMQWKIQAFLEVQRQLDPTPLTNIVALGDANYEIEAARIMADEFAQGLLKTVKFRPHPDPEEHRLQLELVESNLERVIESVHPLKVCLESDA